MLARPGNVDIQLDLFLDYANNVKLYPKFQEYFRKWKPPLLAIWGRFDPYFIPAGAEAFSADVGSDGSVFGHGTFCAGDARGGGGGGDAEVFGE